MGDVIDLSGIGRAARKATVRDDFSILRPGELTYFEYGSGKKTGFSRWVAVARARAGFNVRFTKARIDRVAFTPTGVGGEDGAVAFDYEGKILYFNVVGGAPYPVQKAKLPSLPENSYFIWVTP